MPNRDILRKIYQIVIYIDVIYIILCQLNSLLTGKPVSKMTYFVFLLVLGLMIVFRYRIKVEEDLEEQERKEEEEFLKHLKFANEHKKDTYQQYREKYEKEFGEGSFNSSGERFRSSQKEYQSKQSRTEDGRWRMQVDPKGYFDGCDDMKSIRETYRKLLLKYHPDNGGSEEITAELNAIFDELEKKYRVNASQQT